MRPISSPLVLGLAALTIAESQNTTSSRSCPPIGVTTISPYDISALLRPTTNIDDLLTIQTISDTLAIYPLAVDGQNWDVLDLVFTPDAQTSYPAPIGNFSTLQDLKTGLAAALSKAVFTSTEHAYATQIINVCAIDAAVSVTYVVANQFLNLGYVPGPEQIVDDTDAVYAYAQYQDSWARQGDGSWRITNRFMVYMVSVDSKVPSRIAISDVNDCDSIII